ncbi:hypothetical protein Rsub_10664 [Raphidocelis subcapitata]|uniref:Uncharacterized protein n=1 Tax=Raphidocelis subcapitata TaxID=307507 RepID=A0A2V0PJA9_9CHLO|nr:hypothetical protein Rsub_10664 [Raphidocelis subcapitata]|eukprot:GBF97990.1 hypothetical protein Rsub_10664 [Raphidocelis subcapitata]
MLHRKASAPGLRARKAAHAAPITGIRQRRAQGRHPPPGAAGAAGAAAAAAAGALAFVPPVCFDAECAAHADRAFSVAIAAPLLAAAAALAWVLRRPPKELLDSGRVFEDDVTGTLFEAPDGMTPEFDKNDKLAFKAISYTPWPVQADAPGERLRIAVGRVGSTEPRTFVFEKTLPLPSEIVAVSLPRPLGVIFEFDEKRKRAFVAGFVPGGNAEQRRAVARLAAGGGAQAVMEGDVVRAVTCTTPVWPAKALIGAVAPERHIIVYGADKTRWSGLRGALKRGAVRDGPVTLVLERRAAAAAEGGGGGGGGGKQ